MDIRINSRSFLTVLLLCAACSGPGGVTQNDTPEPITGPREAVNLADYEDFDPAPYEEEPPTPTVIEHDVPESLLDPKVEEQQVTSTGAGYRIQIYAVQDKRVADRQMEDAVAWWRQQERFGSLADVYREQLNPPPIYMDFRQPYYRIRLGNFGSRSAAGAVLELVEEQFPNAFIVPDTIIRTR